MKEIKKYTDVIRYGKSSTVGVIQEGDTISITEKIDGANASFRIDETNPLGVSCYSRNKALDESNTLSGFFGWVNNNILPIKEELNTNYIYFGEWLVKHKVKYKEQYYHNFYLFSIWDITKEQYLSDDIVRSEAIRLNLNTVPYKYIGEYISFEHLMSFVGQSEMTEVPNTGEGVVVKNVSYFDKFNRQCFVKLVSEGFAEVQKQKLPKNPNANDKLVTIIKSVLTKPRVEKLLFKLIDEGLLNENYNIKDMGTILRYLGSQVYEDIMKEESDLFIEFDSNRIKKCIGKITPSVIKEVLKDQGKI